MDFREQYFNVWQEIWRFHKKFHNNDGLDRTWEQIINESSEIARKYEGKPQYNFAKDLILSVLSEIEKKDKERRKHG